MSDNRYTIPKARSAQVDEGLRAHMQRIYNTMALGLLVTGGVSYYVASVPQLFMMFNGTILGIIIALSPLGIIFFGLSPARVGRMSLGTVNALYYLLTALIGVSLSYIYLLYTGGSIARVFFITAGMFAGASIYGYTTRKDLSAMGSLMVMGLIGIIIAGLVNIFLHSAMVDFVTSVIGVVVFTGLTAWDTQFIKESYYAAANRDSAAKMAVMGALSMYLNFINLFMTLLRLFGDRR